MKIYSVSHRDLDTSDIRKFVGKDIWVKVQTRTYRTPDFIRVIHIIDDIVYFNRVSDFCLTNRYSLWPPLREDNVDKFLSNMDHTYLHLISIVQPLEMITTAEVRELLIGSTAT